MCAPPPSALLKLCPPSPLIVGVKLHVPPPPPVFVYSSPPRN